METQTVRKIKLCFDGKKDKRTVRYFFESQDPLKDVKLLRMAAEQVVLKPAYVGAIGEDCILIINPTIGNQIRIPVSFRAFPQQQRVAVSLEWDIGELWLSNIFYELGWTFEFETEEEYRQRCIRASLNEFDLKVLELRSKGLSLWSIARSLSCTIAKVRWSLEKLTLIPEHAEKLGAYKPLPWTERFKPKQPKRES